MPEDQPGLPDFLDRLYGLGSDRFSRVDESSVEIGDNEPLYTGPAHPYTGALLAAVPIADPQQRRDERSLLSGDDD